jgi:hypothetical protein
MSPQEDRIGRCCKVGKEAIFAMLKALELFVNQNYDATVRTYDERAQVITDAIEKFGVVALPREYDPQALGNVTPRYSWKLDRSKLNISGHEVMQKLADTRPLGIGSMGAGVGGMRGRSPNGSGEEQHHSQHPQRDPDSFGFAVWQLKEGEDKIIAARLTEIFSEAPKA